MGYPTPIEWTDATWNPIGGCSIKSPGCRPCYAQKLAGTRLRKHPLYAGTTDTVKGKHVFNGHLTAAADGHPVWRWPLSWRGAKEPKLGAGMPSLIFVGDMSDLFHEDRPAAHIDKVFSVIGEADDIGRRHIFQLLTKRPEVARDYVRSRGYGVWNAPRVATKAWPARNIWLGFSAERQKEFDERWPLMRALAGDGWTIFVSYEPAIGPLTLPPDFLSLGRRAQVIAGGMSGDDDPTPAHPDWFRAVRDQCAAAGVPFFFKQWGEWAPPAALGAESPGIDDCAYGEWHPDGEFVRSCMCSEGTESTYRVGKTAAGRTLDGCLYNGFPAVAPC